MDACHRGQLVSSTSTRKTWRNYLLQDLDVRELILNHASVFSSAGRRAVVAWIKDVAVGMSQLVNERVVEKSLRMYRDPHETLCSLGYSLYDAFQDVRIAGAREEHLFLVTLATKIPLLSAVSADVRDRFLGCENRTLPADCGAPFVLCAISDGIAVGLPSDPVWDENKLMVRFLELLPDGTFSEASEEVDNLSRSAHAMSILGRHSARFRAVASQSELWRNRREAFPHLHFGPGVELNLRLAASHLHTIIGKLAELDRSAAEWRDVGGPSPPWKTKVTPESDTVRNSPSLWNARRFPTRDGNNAIFEWHARYGSGGRIHVRFEPESREVEVGYVGPHLPLK